VTSVEPDHLDYYGGFERLVAAFEQFVDGVPAGRRLRRRRDHRSDRCGRDLAFAPTE
jgi:UDP-N-acetylmuramate-alanine ligase